jgi:hypothetical protein
MNVETGTDASRFPEKEYINVNGIFVAVYMPVRGILYKAIYGTV